MGPFVSSKGGGFQVMEREVEVVAAEESCSGAAIGAICSQGHGMDELHNEILPPN
jgi:hypothetical protein